MFNIEHASSFMGPAMKEEGRRGGGAIATCRLHV